MPKNVKPKCRPMRRKKIKELSRHFYFNVWRVYEWVKVSIHTELDGDGIVHVLKYNRLHPARFHSVDMLDGLIMELDSSCTDIDGLYAKYGRVLERAKEHIEESCVLFETWSFRKLAREARLDEQDA